MGKAGVGGVGVGGVGLALPVHAAVVVAVEAVLLVAGCWQKVAPPPPRPPDYRVCAPSAKNDSKSNSKPQRFEPW